MLKLADFFEVTVDCLVGREGYFVKQMDKDDKKGMESALVGFFRRLPEQEQYRTLGFAQALVSTLEEK